MMNFLLGVLSSLCAMFIAYLATKIVSLPALYPYPDMRGDWKGEYEVDGVKVNETIRVTQQFWKWCRGTFIWINPEEENERVEYSFTGSFKLSNVVTGFIKVKSKRRLDIGTFLILMDHSGKGGAGAIVSIDFKTNQPSAHAYRISRLLTS